MQFEEFPSQEAANEPCQDIGGGSGDWSLGAEHLAIQRKGGPHFGLDHFFISLLLM